jgi:hypothetical protein
MKTKKTRKLLVHVVEVYLLLYEVLAVSNENCPRESSVGRNSLKTTRICLGILTEADSI